MKCATGISILALVLFAGFALAGMAPPAVTALNLQPVNNSNLAMGIAIGLQGNCNAEGRIVTNATA